MEKINLEKNLLICNPSNYKVQASQNRVIKYSKSGKYSLLLDSLHRFGFTYRLYNCNKGDSVIAKVGRYGKNGDIVFNGNATKMFYITGSSIENQDTTGWQQLALKYCIPKNMYFGELGIYVYLSTNDSAYFDDFEVKYIQY